MNNKSLKDIVANTAPEQLEMPAEEMESTPTLYPVLAPESMHGTIGKFVELATQNSEADPAAVLLTLLPALGACYGSTRAMEVGDSVHPPRIFSAIVGTTGKARKGTSAGPVKKLLGLLPGGAAVRNGPLSTGEGILHHVRDARRDDDGKVIDKGVDDKRMFVIEEEFANVFKKSATQGNTLSMTIRTLWDAGPKDVVAPIIKNNPEQSTGPHVCMTAHITPDELRRSLSGTADIKNGFANRYIFGCSRRAKIVPLPKPMDAKELDRIAKNFAGAIEAARDIAESLTFDDQAEALWVEKYAKLSEPLPGVIGDVTTRAEAQVLRLAQIYALTDHSKTIRKPHLIAALAVWDYCAASAAYIFGVEKPSDNGLAKEVVEYIRSNSNECSQTALSTRFRGKPAELKAALEELDRQSRIKGRRGQTGRAGRPTIIWTLLDTAS